MEALALNGEIGQEFQAAASVKKLELVKM